jgi:CRP-like cAMP-binding protein
MLLKCKWADRFINTCAKVRSARRRALAAGESVYLTEPKGRCWVVASGYVRLLDPVADGVQFIRLILGRGGIFGDLPFGTSVFPGFASPRQEQAFAHSPAEVLELDRLELEAASRAQGDLTTLLLESATTRAQFLERRLLWQFKTPVRTRVALTIRDLICFEGQRCRHGYAVDVRLTHQDLSELVGAARLVVSAELVRLRDEGLVSYTRSHFCVENLSGLSRVVAREADIEELSST